MIMTIAGTSNCRRCICCAGLHFNTSHAIPFYGIQEHDDEIWCIWAGAGATRGTGVVLDETGLRGDQLPVINTIPSCNEFLAQVLFKVSDEQVHVSARINSGSFGHGVWSQQVSRDALDCWDVGSLPLTEYLSCIPDDAIGANFGGATCVVST